MRQDLFGQLPQADPADPVRGIAEVPLDELPVQPDRFEDLRPGVGGDRGDPPPGEDLQQPGPQRLQQPGLHLLQGQLDLAPAGQILRRGEQQIGVDRGGAVTDQAGDVVHLADLAGLHGEPDPQPRPLLDQVLVHRGGGQQRRHRGPLGRDPSVGHDQHRHARAHRVRGPRPQPLHRLGQAVRARRDRPGRVQGARPPRARPRPDRRQVGIAQHRIVEHDLPLALGTRLEQVLAGSKPRAQAHHHALPHRVDRRVGDLGEPLCEVVEQRPRPPGQHRQRRVVTHRAVRFLGPAGHGPDQVGQILLGVTEQQLPATQRVLLASGTGHGRAGGSARRTSRAATHSP